MRKFNPGDIVVCIEENLGIEVGKNYTIVECEDDSETLPVVQLKEVSLFKYFTRRFKLIEPLSNKKTEGWGF